MIYAIKYNLNLEEMWEQERTVYADEINCLTPYTAMVLVDDRTFFGDWTMPIQNEKFHDCFDEWIAETMPGRCRAIVRGVHDFCFDGETLPGSDEPLDYCRQITYVFDQPSDQMLFKLRWGFTS